MIFNRMSEFFFPLLASASLALAGWSMSGVVDAKVENARQNEEVKNLQEKLEIMRSENNQAHAEIKTMLRELHRATSITGDKQLLLTGD